MSYERQNSTRLEQYRARQAERIDAMNRAIEAGQTTVVASSSENAGPVSTPFSVEIKTATCSVTAIGAVKALFEGSMPKFRRRRVAKHFGMFTGSTPADQGRKKNPTAAGVEIAIRPRIDVKAAALISGATQDGPQDGQLFAYDASTGRMVPVNENDVVQRIRGRGRPRRQNLATARNK
ncbi:hypothetical protein HG548_22295 [Citrobacter sp. DNRA3]|uniref:hypothetical protein n=1 Tax=Citrobacter sp. DNRA3 TaxID=2723054 RepID=UPI001459A954|nr:hypothetical protein [Citrobacter sp. DNRA3]NBJ31820.1 hypothetical protein [Citrobacter freundii]NMD77249.1 hypothetical protein [Citrobacter sp. DNRA3]